MSYLTKNGRSFIATQLLVYFPFCSKLAWKDAYLDSHHDNKAVFDDFVVGHSLSLVVHDFSIGYQLLSLRCLSMRLLNQSFQLRDLHTRAHSVITLPPELSLSSYSFLSLTVISGCTSKGSCWPFRVLRVIFMVG